MSKDSNSRLSRRSENISVQSIATPSTSRPQDAETEDAQTSTRSTEDVMNLQCTSAGLYKGPNTDDREPIFVIVDSHCESNPSSKEMLINKKNVIMENSLKKYKRKVIPDDIPCTSRDQTNFMLQQSQDGVSREEMEMVDINLQSENDISVDDGNNETEPESIVIAYLRNKDAIIESEEIITTKKKSSLLEHVPKMETIPEDKQFTTFSGQLRIGDTKESENTGSIETDNDDNSE